MASADAVFMAAHYKAIQRKMSEGSNSDDKSRSRKGSFIDDIKEGVSKFTKNFSGKGFSGTRRRTVSCDVPDSDSSPPSSAKPDRLRDKRNQFSSMHQKSMDSKIQEQPEAEQAQARLYNKKEVIKRGRLQSAPVSSSDNRRRSESEAIPSNGYKKEVQVHRDSEDDVFEEEEPVEQQKQSITRL